MVEIERFRAALWAYVGRQSSKTAAAATLNVTRTDLYRYLSGETVPRPARLDEMVKTMSAGGSPKTAAGVEIPHMSEESVTQMRDMLLHLASLLDLDLTSRRVIEGKGG